MRPERGLLVGEAIFGALFIVLIGSMVLAALCDAAADWEDRQENKD